MLDLQGSSVFCKSQYRLTPKGHKPPTQGPFVVNNDKHWASKIITLTLEISCPGDHITNDLFVETWIRWLVLSVSSNLWYSDRYEILHMSRQLSRRGMCKIL